MERDVVGSDAIFQDYHNEWMFSLYVSAFGQYVDLKNEAKRW